MGKRKREVDRLEAECCDPTSKPFPGLENATNIPSVNSLAIV